jgi:MoxR-like ATPase
MSTEFESLSDAVIVDSGPEPSLEPRLPGMGTEGLPELREAVQTEIAKAVVGEASAVDLLLIAALCGGHVLLESAPGTAKTLLSTAIARVLGVHFKRVQFTSDTTPTEILGRMTKVEGVPTFERGAIFTNVLLADEINRTPPRTQAALLEAMQERRVTAGGRSYFLELPFFVIATQNPFEHEGVFSLPESQLDRFLFKIDLEYPDADKELAMLAIPHQGLSPDVIGEVQPLLGEMRFIRAQALIDTTEVPQDVGRYVVRVVRRTRELPGVVMGGSPRASIHLQGAAKARARLEGRDTVTVDDVRAMAPVVLTHRITVDATTTREAVVANALAVAGARA